MNIPKLFKFKITRDEEIQIYTAIMSSENNYTIVWIDEDDNIEHSTTYPIDSIDRFIGSGDWTILNFDKPIQRGFSHISYAQWKKDRPLDVEYEEWCDCFQELKLPKRATAHSAGYDIFSPFGFTLEVGESIKLPTGFKAYMLEDEMLVGHVRSSIGFKYHVRLSNITMVGDSDFYNNKDNEGHYSVKIRNEGDVPVTIKRGEAIAQCIFQKYLLADGDDFSGEVRVGGIGSTNG